MYPRFVAPPPVSGEKLMPGGVAPAAPDEGLFGPAGLAAAGWAAGCDKTGSETGWAFAGRG